MKKFDINQLKMEYKANKAPWREWYKWFYALGMFGLSIGLSALFLPWTIAFFVAIPLGFLLGPLQFLMTTQIVQEGQIAARTDFQGRVTLLPPGRYSNFPWESYITAPQSLAKAEIHIGPYTLLRVDTGFVAKTLHEGHLDVLGEGLYLLPAAHHVFERFVSIKQITKRLDAVNAYTSDSVGLLINADVRYQITDPVKALSQLEDIENSIKEIAEFNISQVVAHHRFQDFAPSTSKLTTVSLDGMDKVINELIDEMKKQLQSVGVTLINIGIIDRTINDKALAHEMGEMVVFQLKAQSQLDSVENETKVIKTKAIAEAEATVTTAKAKAEAIQVEGDALKKLGDSMKDNPAALQIYTNNQLITAYQQAKNLTIFNTSPSIGGVPSILVQTPSLGGN